MLVPNNEFCCSPGTITTVLAGSQTWCMSFVCSVASTTCSSGVSSTFPDDTSVGMKGYITLSQWDVAPEFVTMDGIAPLRTSVWNPLVLCFFLLFLPLSLCFHVIFYAICLLPVILLLELGMDLCPLVCWFPCLLLGLFVLGFQLIQWVGSCNLCH